MLKPLHDAAGLRRVRVSTYQSVSGAGAQRMEQLRREPSEQHDLAMDWTWEGDETDEESKIRAETQKILELRDLPLSATTVRVPVLVGHAEAVWIELDEPLSPEHATGLLRAAPSVRVVDVPTPQDAAQVDDVLVGRIRPDRAGENGLANTSVTAGASRMRPCALRRRPLARLRTSSACAAGRLSVVLTAPPGAQDHSESSQLMRLHGSQRLLSDVGASPRIGRRGAALWRRCGEGTFEM